MSDWTNGKWLNGISGNNVTFLNNSDYTVYMTCVAYNEQGIQKSLYKV